YPISRGCGCISSYDGAFLWQKQETREKEENGECGSWDDGICCRQRSCAGSAASFPGRQSGKRRAGQERADATEHMAATRVVVNYWSSLLARVEYSTPFASSYPDSAACTPCTTTAYPSPASGPPGSTYQSCTQHRLKEALFKVALVVSRQYKPLS